MGAGDTCQWVGRRLNALGLPGSWLGLVSLLRSAASVPPRRLHIVGSVVGRIGVPVMAAEHGPDGRGRPGESAARAGLRMVRFPRAHHFKGGVG